MRLLVVTQEVDIESKTLSFFPEWLRALAPHYERIEVICLKEGTHVLPPNVRVHSLGKEHGSVPSFVYAFRFKVLAWKLRNEYDAVFVHMNQEYILIAGLLWKLLGKHIYLWRNHYAGSLLTDIAASFCAKVFCTSKHSYTAKYKKTVFMPVGVDLSRFSDTSTENRVPNSILFLARMSPSKRPEVLLEALSLVHAQGLDFTATFVGDSLPEYREYYASLKQLVSTHRLDGRVSFLPGVPHEETGTYYRSHDIFVNCSPSGMYDKTLFEAAAAGCVVLAVSKDFGELAGEAYAFSDEQTLAARLEALSHVSRDALRSGFIDLAQTQSLVRLAEVLKKAIL